MISINFQRRVLLPMYYETKLVFSFHGIEFPILTFLFYVFIIAIVLFLVVKLYPVLKGIIGESRTIKNYKKELPKKYSNLSRNALSNIRDMLSKLNQMESRTNNSIKKYGKGAENSLIGSIAFDIQFDEDSKKIKEKYGIYIGNHWKLDLEYLNSLSL